MKKIKLSPRDRALLYRALIMIAALWLLLLVQTSFLPHFPFFGSVPDLAFVLVVVTARETDEKFSGTVGLFAGVLSFMMGDVGAAVWILFYAALGFFSSVCFRRLMGRKYLSYLIFTACAAFCKYLYGVILCVLLSTDVQFFRVLYERLFPEFLITVFAAAVLYVPFRAFVKRVARGEGI